MRWQTDVIHDRLSRIWNSLSHPPVMPADKHRESFVGLPVDADSFSRQLNELQHSLRAQPDSTPDSAAPPVYRSRCREPTRGSD